MRAKPTSAEAFREVQERGADVSLQERILYDLYHRGDATRRGLARRMQMEDRWSSLTARVRELLDMGLVQEVGTREDPETGAQGAVLQTTMHAIPWLQGDYEPEPSTRIKQGNRVVSNQFMHAVRKAVDNPGSITAWNTLKQAYEQETQA